MPHRLFYGDNLYILRNKIKSETVDLCYIDPPFNSKRNYNQIYNRVGEEDTAQAQAFIDTWTWDDRAIEGRDEILANAKGRFQPQVVELIKGLQACTRRRQPARLPSQHRAPRHRDSSRPEANR